MAGCFCNHSKDPNATISWTLVSAEDAPLHALVPTIVSLRRIEAGEFVMLDYGVRYSMDAAHCQQYLLNQALLISHNICDSRRHNPQRYRERGP